MLFFIVGFIFIIFILFSFSKMIIEKFTVPNDALKEEIADLKRRVDQLERNQ